MVVASGLIAGAAAIGGGILSAKAQKKAAKTAAQAATDNTEANNALARDIYGQNKATLSPFVQSGTNAGSAINALLGLSGPAPVVGAPQASQPVSGSGVNALFRGNDLWRGEPGGFHYNSPIDGNPTDTFVGNQAMPQTAVTTTAAPQTGQQSYQNAFDNYRNSTGYQFRLGEGTRALDNSYASRGVGQSGAAAKAAMQYGQNIASGEFNNYLNALFNQQGVGLSAAGAQAGVSTNFLNTTTQNNNNAASAAANAAIARGNANSNMWSGIAGGLGSIFGSSFG